MGLTSLIQLDILNLLRKSKEYIENNANNITIEIDNVNSDGTESLYQSKTIADISGEWDVDSYTIIWYNDGLIKVKTAVTQDYSMKKFYLITPTNAWLIVFGTCMCYNGDIRFPPIITAFMPGWSSTIFAYGNIHIDKVTANTKYNFISIGGCTVTDNCHSEAIVELFLIDENDIFG